MSFSFRRTALLLALGATVAGCATSPEQLAQRNSDRCVARGFRPNTDDHANCVTRLDAERDARIDARHRELVERRAATPFER
jgi:hypothetical protein